jgi:CheY-like chemotaxis protein/HPt (histidine-containing phosphotransfer) domain-containing protein
MPLLGKILVVEDNPVNLAVVRKMLQKAGLNPVTAHDGVEALEILELDTFDLVLMDCQMPRMDGYQATEAIRLRESQKGLIRLPVIAMTANAMAGDREKCLDAGMDDYLAKPVKPASLETMLRQWLPMREAIMEDEISQDPTQTQPGTSRRHLDSTVLEELYEIMDDEFVSVLQSYLDNAPGLLRGIRDAVAAKDFDALVTPSHSLKSSSANVGGMELSMLARELEFKGRQRETKGMVEVFNQLAETYRHTTEELKQIVNQGSLRL